MLAQAQEQPALEQDASDRTVGKHREARMHARIEARRQELRERGRLQAASATQAVGEQDSLALVALYNATDGVNWENNEGWLSAPVADWYGVTVSEDRVIRVSLRGNQLTGPVPPELGQLDDLSELGLANNQLTGAIPSELGQLANLQYLYLLDNQLTGPIPPVLGQLGELMGLYLYDNQLTGPIPPELGQLGDLRYLYIDGNQLTGPIPPELGQLGDLFELGLWDNQLTGSLPSELGQLTNLQYLYLDGNPLAGPIPLTLTNLTDLILFYFDDTNLCEPSDPAFQDWLASVDEVQRTGERCAEQLAAVTFADQIAQDGLTVMVDSLFLPEGGYVALHDSTLFGTDGEPFTADDQPLSSVVGVSAYFGAGAQQEVQVMLFENVPGLDAPADTALQTGQTLIAMPHQETSGNQQYDFLTSGGSEDGPYVDVEGQAIIDAAFIRLDGPPPVADSTPPVCGQINVEQNETGDLAVVRTSATDPESGIASVTFTTLDNLEGFLGADGPFSEGETQHFPETPETVAIRGERIDFGQGGAILTEVTNAAGLSSQCDPATERVASTPERLGLAGNYPNPVRTQTTITFHLPEASPVRLEVFDMLGRRVASLVEEKLAAGTHQVEWDTEGAASGTYLYRLKAGDFEAVRRLVVIK